jgi:hypothetical protein
VTRVTIGRRLRDRFTERLLPDAVFQITPGYLSGVRVARADRSVKGGFVLPFRERPVVPSFDRPNVTDPPALEEAIAQGMKNLGLASGTAGLLLPEPSVRVFVFAVDNFPRTGREREAFLRWRIAKQMPFVPDDARIDFAATAGRGPRRIITAMARQAVVREYEALFEKAGLKPVLAGVPSLALAKLVRRDGRANDLLLNLEDETLTLLALAESGWTLYRLKDVGSAAGSGAEERADNIVREAENTIRFLEDKERTRTDRLWLRSAAEAEVPEIARRLKDRAGVAVKAFDYEAPKAWTEAHKAVLAPLIGQVL